MSATDVLDAYDKAAAWDDLRRRLERAQTELCDLALNQAGTPESARLVSKAQGVALALDYMRGYG